MNHEGKPAEAAVVAAAIWKLREENLVEWAPQCSRMISAPGRGSVVRSTCQVG